MNSPVPIDSTSLLSKVQHGFSQGRYCLTNFLKTFEAWTTALDEEHGMDVIYLDYRKAFDTVWQNGLLRKLECYGIGGKALAWIRSFWQDGEWELESETHFQTRLTSQVRFHRVRFSDRCFHYVCQQYSWMDKNWCQDVRRRHKGLVDNQVTRRLQISSRWYWPPNCMARQVETRV